MLLSGGETVARRRDDDRHGDDGIDPRDPDRLRPHGDRPAARRRARSRVPSRRRLADARAPLSVRGRARHACLSLVVSGRRRGGDLVGRRTAGDAGADPDRRERARDRLGARGRGGPVRVDAGERPRRGRARARPRRDTPAGVDRRRGARRCLDHVPGRGVPREPRARRRLPRGRRLPRPPHAADDRRGGVAPGRRRPRSPGVLRGGGGGPRGDRRLVVAGRSRRTWCRAVRRSGRGTRPGRARRGRRPRGRGDPRVSDRTRPARRGHLPGRDAATNGTVGRASQRLRRSPGPELAALCALHDHRARGRRRRPRARLRAAVPRRVGARDRRGGAARCADGVVSARPDPHLRVLPPDPRRVRPRVDRRADRSSVARLADRDRARHAHRRAGDARLARTADVRLAGRAVRPDVRRSDRLDDPAGHRPGLRGR